MFSADWFVQLRKADISTLDGWQQFVADRNRYQPPPMYDRDTYEALTPADRGMYDLARRIATANLPKHETPMTAQIREAVDPVLQANLFSTDPGVRAGLFVSADGGLGKSTLVREIAADFDNDIRGLRELAPGLVPYRDRWVPVGWVTVPPKLSIKSLTQAILTFYGAPYRVSDSDPTLIKRVETNIRHCGTRLLVLDDITRYKDGEADRQASDWIRNLMETSVTIIAMGVDVQGSGILYDGRTRRQNRLRSQTGRRFTVHDLEPFTYDTVADIRDWVAHLTAVENDLMLLDKAPGMLSDKLADYLYRKTEGVIGVLQRWVSIVAMLAVGRPEHSGGEYLTGEDFDRVPVPSVSELKDDFDLGETPAPKPKAKRPKGRVTTYDQPQKKSA